MKHTKKTAAFAAAALVVSAQMPAFAAESAFRISMSGEQGNAWSQIAMANDDTVDTGVNIRSAADAEAKAVGCLYRGGAVKVLDRGETWSEVQSGNVTGYIKNEYLTFGEEAKGLAEHYGVYGVSASWNDVNVFAGNDAGAKILEQANDGDTFRYIATDGHWIQVQKAKGTAFVSADDVSSVILLDTAVPIEGEDVPVNENVVGAAQITADWNSGAGESAQSEEPAYTEPTYTEPVYEEPVYTEPAYTEPTYTEPAYSEPVSGSDVYGGSEVQRLYQAYLDAQAAADAAVANGAGEDEIIRTCQAAQAAYGAYVTAQNKADAERYGYAYTEPSAGTGAADQTPGAGTASSDTYGDDSYDDGSDDSYDDGADDYYDDGSDDDYYDDGSDDDYYDDEEDDGYYDDDSSDDGGSSAGSADVSASDLELLAALIYCEAGNQPYDGQVAVGAVVMNRIASGSFPGTVHDVIYQSGQFTPAYSGALASAMANGSGANYIGAASDAMSGSDPTGGKLYFNTSHGSGVKIGAHWFY